MVNIQNSQEIDILCRKPWGTWARAFYKQDRSMLQSSFPRSQLHGIYFQQSTTGSIVVCISQCLVMAAWALPELYYQHINFLTQSWATSLEAMGQILVSRATPLCFANRKMEASRVYKPKHYHSLPSEEISTKQPLLGLSCCPTKHTFSEKLDFNRKLHNKSRFLTGFRDHSHPRKKPKQTKNQQNMMTNTVSQSFIVL